MGSGAILPAAGQPTRGADPAFVQSGAQRQVSINADHIGPPSNLYIAVDDKLVILMVSSTTETIQWQARLLLPTGDIKQVGGSIPNGGALYQLQRQVTQLAEGYLLSVCAAAVNARVRGITFVSAYISRPAGTGFSEAAQLLFADYVFQDINGTGLSTQLAGWPNGRVVSPMEGYGAQQNRSIGNPAAGADWSFQLNTGVRGRFRTISATLTTSATVANRIVRGVFTDSSNHIVWQGPPSAAIPAATVAQVSFAPGATQVSTVDPTTIIVPLPADPFFGSTFFFKTSTVAIQAGDQWANIFIVDEELLEL